MSNNQYIEDEFEDFLSSEERYAAAQATLEEFHDNDPILYEIVQKDLLEIRDNYVETGDVEEFNHNIRYMRNIPSLYSAGPRVDGTIVYKYLYERHTEEGGRQLPNGEIVPNFRQPNVPGSEAKDMFSHMFYLVQINKRSGKLSSGRFEYRDPYDDDPDNIQYVNMSFEDIRKTLKNLYARNYAEIERNLKFNIGGSGGEYIDNNQLQLDTDSYEYYLRKEASGGAFNSTKSHHYKKYIINNISVCDYESTENNCLFAILASACDENGKKITDYSTTQLRMMSGAPSNTPIKYDSPVIYKLAKDLGINIVIVSDLKINKIFHDNPITINKNTKLAQIKDHFKCEIQATFEEMHNTGDIRLQKYISGEDRSPMEIRQEIFILLSNDHYYHVCSKVVPAHCEITGELLSLNKKGKPVKLLSANVKQILLEQKRAISKKKEIFRYMFFDFETVYMDNSKLIPYSCSVALYDPEFSKNYSKYCETMDKDKVLKEYGGNAYGYDQKSELLLHYVCGKNTLKKLFHVLKGNNIGLDDGRKRTTILVGYNNARFDNSLLVTMLTHQQMLNPKSLFVANNSILKLDFNGCKTVDLCRFLVMPLAAACKSFGCENQKGSLDHSIIQQRYIDNRAKFWSDLKDEKSDLYTLHDLKNYNMMDVISLKELYFKVENALQHIYSDKKYNFKYLHDYMTLSNMAYKCLKRDFAQKKIKLAPPESLEQFNFMRSCIIAGRSQIFNYGKFTHDVESKDVKSLYPFVMICDKCYYVAGTIEKHVENESEYRSDKLGFYECIVSNQPRTNPNVEPEINIIPYRSKDAPLDYDYDGPIRCGLTTVDIELCRKYGCKVEIIKGLYYSDKSNKLFTDYYARLIDVKNNEDRLSAAGDPAYNPALRTMSKGIQNGVAGKFLQRFFNSEHCITRNEIDMANFEKKIDKDTVKYTRINEHYIWAEGENLLGYQPKKAKEIQHGLYVYSYARAHMYESILSKVKRSEIFAMDTDSVHMTRAAVNRLAELPENIAAAKAGDYFGHFIEGMEYGNFTSELADDYKAVGDKISYYIAPKFYFYDMIGHDNVRRFKCRAKGVNTNRDKLISLNDIETLFMDRNNLRDALFVEDPNDFRPDVYKKNKNIREDKFVKYSSDFQKYDRYTLENRRPIHCVNAYEEGNIISYKNIMSIIANTKLSLKTEIENGNDDEIYKYENNISRIFGYLKLDVQKKFFDSVPSMGDQNSKNDQRELFERLIKDKYVFVLSSMLKRNIVEKGSIGNIRQRYMLKMLCPINEYISRCKSGDAEVAPKSPIMNNPEEVRKLCEKSIDAEIKQAMKIKYPEQCMAEISEAAQQHFEQYKSARIAEIYGQQKNIVGDDKWRAKVSDILTRFYDALSSVADNAAFAPKEYPDDLSDSDDEHY